MSVKVWTAADEWEDAAVDVHGSAADASLRTALHTRGGWETLTGFANQHDTMGEPHQHGRYSNVTGDAVSWHVWLDAGLLGVDYFGLVGSAHGVAEALLDGVSAFTFDTYAPGGDAGAWLRDVGTLEVAEPGMHDVALRVTGTHSSASSGNFVGPAALYLKGGRVGLVPVVLGDLPYSRNGMGSTIPMFLSSYGVGRFGEPGEWIEAMVWLDGGTYAIDKDVFLGTTHGVERVDIDGTPVGTPQPPNTPRPGGSGGNGNIGGAALSIGEIDHYDTTDVGTSVIPNALTGVEVEAGWHLVRVSIVGANSAATATHTAEPSIFRRTA